MSRHKNIIAFCMVVAVETPTKLLLKLGTPKQKAFLFPKFKRKMKEQLKDVFNTDALREFVKDEEPGFNVAQTLDEVIYNYIMAHDGSLVNTEVIVHDVWSLMRLRNVFIRTAIDNGQATQENMIKYFNTLLNLC